MYFIFMRNAAVLLCAEGIALIKILVVEDEKPISN
jgi:hypothetical protein